MDDAKALRLTAVSGVMVGVLTLLIGPLYFVYSPGPPQPWDVFTRDLLNLVVAVFIVVFASGFRDFIRRVDPAGEWLSGIIYGCALIYVTLFLVATSMEAGGVFGHPGGKIDPTSQGPLAQGSILLHGSVARIITVLFLVAAGYAVQRIRALPRWLSWTAYAVAAANLIFVPSIYFGSSEAAFYSALGWGNTALVDSLVELWILGAGIAMLRSYRTVATVRGHAVRPTQVPGNLPGRGL